VLHPNDGETTCSDETLDILDRTGTPDRLGLLAHYEILEIVGRGGMGVVLQGVDVRLNRVVAIKVLAPQLAANAMSRQRFLREAQAAAAVSHDHVVTIHAVNEFKGLPYLVMEYISGPSLQQKIDASGALALAEILRIGMQTASGLAAAHAQGLVHRDIKPANILLENGIERVKITDFGLARSVDDVRITRAGAVYGTPQYMSPEQAQGERVDQRSDLFSLGSVLYAMCTGRPPFRGDTGLAVLKRVCDDTPRPIQEVNPDIPAALAEIVDKLHAKKPADRLASAQEIADLLGRCLSELQQHGRVELPADALLQLKPTSETPEPVPDTLPKSEKRPFHGRRWLMAVAASLLLFAGFGLTEATGFTTVSGTVIRLFSPDGTLVVEVDDPGVSVAIDGEELVITGTGVKEIRLKPGKYKVQASKDGKLVHQELVTVTKNGRQVVRVSREGQSVAPEHRTAASRGTTPRYSRGVADRPVKVYILAGDSNMAGRAKVSLMRYQASQPETKKRFEHLLGDDGRWVVRQDVWVKNFNQMGDLTAGFGQSPDRFGPELEFGNVVGDHFDEQVLLIKTCFGGHNIYRDFRPPSAGLPPQEVLEQRWKELQKEKPDATLAEVQQTYGATYRVMLKEIRETLANLDENFPYQGQGFEIAGFVWFSGWNDMLDFNPSYVELLAQFIRDVRRDLKTPNLPFIIGQLGVNPDGVQPGANDAKIRIAQADVAELPEFKANVKLVATDPFWDRDAHAIEKLGLHEPREGWDKVGSDLGYHYLGSAKTFCAMGKAFGEGMLELSRSGAKN
jgi:serine/threonine protein kinase